MVLIIRKEQMGLTGIRQEVALSIRDRAPLMRPVVLGHLLTGAKYVVAGDEYTIPFVQTEFLFGEKVNSLQGFHYINEGKSYAFGRQLPIVPRDPPMP